MKSPYQITKVNVTIGYTTKKWLNLCLFYVHWKNRPCILPPTHLSHSHNSTCTYHSPKYHKFNWWTKIIIRTE